MLIHGEHFGVTWCSGNNMKLKTYRSVDSDLFGIRVQSSNTQKNVSMLNNLHRPAQWPTLFICLASGVRNEKEKGWSAKLWAGTVLTYLWPKCGPWWSSGIYSKSGTKKKWTHLKTRIIQLNNFNKLYELLVFVFVSKYFHPVFVSC